MAFPVDLTVALTGATPRQLQAWRRPPDALLAPEISARPVAYSFRDVVALRTVVYLRSQVSLQKIRTAFRSLAEMELTDHPSRYQLATDGTSMYLIEADGVATDLVKQRGQMVLANLGDIFKPFRNFRDREVVDFLHPRPQLEVREGKMGGWPTIKSTRVPYDTVARLQRGPRGLAAREVRRFYPHVSAAAAREALDFDEHVRAM